MPTLDNLPAEPATMSHADHYFRFASIVEKKYNFLLAEPFKASQWISDHGGFLTSVLKTDASRILQAS